MKSALLPTSFGICGSCVSVDIFTYNKDSRGELTDHPAMRDNTFFQTKRRPTRPLEGLRHDSSLHTMWLRTAYDGQVFEFLHENVGEYCLIDLVDERFDLFEYDGQNFVSHFFEESNFFELVERNQCSYFSQRDIPEPIAEQYIKHFCEQLMSIYPAKKIIINRFLLADKYYNKKNEIKDFSNTNQLVHISKSKDLFPKWYDLFVKYLPGCRELILDKEYLAFDSHPRGLSPTHRTMDYYKDAYISLLGIINQDYKEQRKKPLESFAPVMKVSDKDVSILKALGCSQYLSTTLIRMQNITTLKGKKILWICNKSVPATAIRSLKIDKFCQIFVPNGDIEEKTLINKYPDLQLLHDRPIAPSKIFTSRNFAYYYGELSELNTDFLDQFDVVFFDDIEYTHDFGLCLDNLYKVLRHGGTFIAKTGRTWSSPDGNKWNCGVLDNYIRNTNDIFSFCHLLSTPKEISKIIEKKYKYEPESRNDKAICIYTGDKKLNHMFYEDYETAVRNSLFARKRIAPIYPVSVSEDTMSLLKERYMGYCNFNYKSLLIACNK